MRLLTAREAGQVLGVSADAVRRWARIGSLDVIRRGRRVYFDSRVIDDAARARCPGGGVVVLGDGQAFEGARGSRATRRGRP